MEKNVKIDEATHRRVSVAAAQMGVKKGQLFAVLINAALDTLSQDELKELVFFVTNNGNSKHS